MLYYVFLCCFLHLGLLSRVMETIIKANSRWRESQNCPTAASAKVQWAERISFGCPRKSGLVPAVKKSGCVPAVKKNGCVPAVTKNDCVPAVKKSGCAPAVKMSSCVQSGFVPASRPTSFRGAERVAVKSGPVAAATAVAPGHSEAVAKICVNKQCLLNICEVSHEGKHVPKTMSCAIFQAPPGILSGSHKNSQLWNSSVAAMKRNVQQSVAEFTAKTYRYWWNRFYQFCCRTGATQMPFSGRTAAVFLSSLAESAAGLGGVDTGYG